MTSNLSLRRRAQSPANLRILPRLAAVANREKATTQKKLHHYPYRLPLLSQKTIIQVPQVVCEKACKIGVVDLNS